MTDDELLQLFISQQTLPSHNTKQPFAIGLIGLPGSGKSTVVRALADRLGIYIASNDVIRRFLNSQGYAGDAPVQQTLQYIAESLSAYLYENNISHIIDADLLKFYEAAHKKAESYDAKFYMIEVVCPENIIRQRIADRAEEITAGTSITTHERILRNTNEGRLYTKLPLCLNAILRYAPISHLTHRCNSSLQSCRRTALH